MADIQLKDISLEPVDSPIRSAVQLRQRCDSKIYRGSVCEYFQTNLALQLGENIFRSESVKTPIGKKIFLANEHGSDTMGFNRGIGQKLEQSSKEIFYSVEDHGVWFPVDLSRIQEGSLMTNNERFIYNGFMQVMNVNRALVQINAMIKDASRVEDIAQKFSDTTLNPIIILNNALNKIALRPDRMIISRKVFLSIKNNPIVQDLRRQTSGTFNDWLKDQLDIDTLIIVEAKREVDILQDRVLMLYTGKEGESEQSGLVFDQDLPIDFVENTWGFKEGRFILRYFTKPEEGHVGTVIYKGSCAYDVKVIDPTLMFTLTNTINPMAEITFDKPATKTTTYMPDSSTKDLLEAIKIASQKEGNSKLEKQVAELAQKYESLIKDKDNFLAKAKKHSEDLTKQKEAVEAQNKALSDRLDKLEKSSN